MTISKNFYEAVESNEVRRVRIMMKDSLLVDLSFKQFEQMEKIASNMSSLYDNHDGKEFILDKSLWNDDYMNKLKVQVVNNFSHERIEHLKDVIRYLRPFNENVPKDKVSISKKINKDLSYQEQKKLDQKSGNYREVKIISGAVVGAVIGGGVATATSVTVVGGAVVGAVVGGTIVTIATAGK